MLPWQKGIFHLASLWLILSKEKAAFIKVKALMVVRSLRQEAS
jgi:hypothetical protein